MKKIFLTGASSGIGLETARLLCAQGHQVWGTSRRLDRLPQDLPNFHPVEMDLGDLQSVCKAFATALQEACNFDVLINNAGSGSFAPAHVFSDADWKAQFQVLLFGPLELVRLARPTLEKASPGLILNVSSLASILPIPFMGPYSAAKAALSSFSSNLRLELAGAPLRIVDVRPADVATPFHEQTPNLASKLESSSPLGKACERAWNTIGKNMAEAPSPRLVAEAIGRLVVCKNPPPHVDVGSFFQAFLSPLGVRFLPRRLLEAMIRSYYRY